MGECLAEGQLGEQPHPTAALPTQAALGALCVIPDLGGPCQRGGGERRTGLATSQVWMRRFSRLILEWEASERGA